jgi:hypothetical protein
MKLRTLPCLLAALLSLSTVSFGDQLENLRHVHDDLIREANLNVQRERYERSIKDYATLPAKRINQLFALHVENRQITLTPLIKPTQNSVNRKALLTGYDTPALIIYCQWFNNQPDMQEFELHIEDFSTRLSWGVLHLQWQPNGTSTPDFNLDNTIQGPSDRSWRVEFHQGLGRVRLVANSIDGGNPQEMPESVNLIEKDFVSLRQKHPAETEKWLRPIFRRLQQNNVFAADSNAAWQALADHWPVSDSTTRAIEQLTPNLASTDWHQRRKAADQLAKLGRDGATAILRLDRASFTVEQNARLDEVLSRFSPLPDNELANLRNDPNFLLDCEYSDDITVRRLAADRLKQITGHASGITVDGPDGARADMIEKARNEFGPAH